MGNGPVANFIGEPSELTCSFSPTNPPIDPGSWFAPGGLKIGTCRTTCTTSKPSKYRLSVHTSGTMTLTIDDTQFSDFGSYTCKVSTVDDTQSVAVELRKRECPMRTPLINCSSSVAVGGSIPLTIQCSDQLSGNVFYYHQAHYDIVHLPGSSSILPTAIATNSSFLGETVNLTIGIILNVMEDPDLEIITQCCRNTTKLPCESTGDNVCSDVCNTTVLYPPSDLVLKRFPSGPWREGSRNASILCTSNGFPSPTVSWLREDGENSHGVIMANEPGSSTLIFPEVQRHLAGAYQCEADNGMESVAREITVIHVQFPPGIDRLEPVVHANEGTVTSLRCVVSASPLTSSMITWSIPKQSLIAIDVAFSERDSETELESILLFKEKVQRDIFGNYTCTADNSLGRDSFVIQLTGNCYPDAPYDLRVVSYSESSLTLSWTPGEDGGLPTTFTVSYCINVSQVERTCKTERAIVTTNLTVSKLRSYTLYGITVLAVNDVGNSKTGAGIRASTAPEALEDFGIKASYQIGSGKLYISPAKLHQFPHSLCIYAEFHVGGFRHRNETCLRPGQTRLIQNGAKENQLWLVVCGRGVCSSPSPVEYTDDKPDELMFIVVPVLSCFIGFVLLLLLIMCIRQLRGRRMELSTRSLQTPSAHPTIVGTVRSDHTEGTYKTTVSETYEVMENRRVDKGPVHSYLLPSTPHGGDTLRSVTNHPRRPEGDAGALPLDDQGYTPMDPSHEGVYMTHLGHGPACPTQVDVGDITCGSKYANLETCPDATDIQPDDTDYDDVSVYGTYTTSEGALHHEYLEEASHAPKLMETAL